MNTEREREREEIGTEAETFKVLKTILNLNALPSHNSNNMLKHNGKMFCKELLVLESKKPYQ